MQVTASLTDEDTAIADLMRRPGHSVFIGPRRKQNGLRSQVMIAKDNDRPYKVAVTCAGENHEARAAAIVERYYAVQEETAVNTLMRRPGLLVIIGRRRQRDRTDVMAAPRGPSGIRGGIWFRAVSCVGADHPMRAAAIVAAYRALPREKQ
jgi:DNA-binding transcriptional regulator of glucitol operon